VVNGVIVAENSGAGQGAVRRAHRPGRRVRRRGRRDGGAQEGPFPMSKAQYAQRHDGRVAALQYLYAWSINPPANIVDDLRVFFEAMEQPRDHYAFGEELIDGVVKNQAGIDAQIKELAQNWEFERIAKIDLAILRDRDVRDAPPQGHPAGRLDKRGHRHLQSSSRTRTPSGSSTGSWTA
jgi:hypothetical protein